MKNSDGSGLRGSTNDSNGERSENGAGAVLFLSKQY